MNEVITITVTADIPYTENVITRQTQFCASQWGKASPSLADKEIARLLAAVREVVKENVSTGTLCTDGKIRVRRR